ncbi:MAG TPA: acetyl-CoA carboxylase biotin carboxylase subunit [Bryobacterales bacterium]|nr:acetyl-CoA carboxylase biotin carboxylase subunit [Bryobacterales bacterium]
MFQKILIANRGEIAVRVIRTCRAMGIASVAVYSDADRASLHVRLADECAWIGPAAAAESYLNIERILDAARAAGADAIHPGYGFLSENAVFAEACEKAGIKFIGPPAAAMRLMGSKTSSRRAMSEAGVPVVPGTTEPLANAAEAAATAANIGYPVMLKAAGGGGGKGMRLVASADEIASAFEQAQGEAQQAFGNPDIYIEKAIRNPRHIEVQVMADEHGNVIHLGERECSLQRRHQKVLEEAPAPLVAEHPRLRAEITRAAVEAAKAAGYTNAGTVEFLADAAGDFYFLEMNTRLQVEHPVTEMITGLDLVREQILVAAGERLSLAQEDVRMHGHAIECRVYAEDPENEFLPSPGRITSLTEPSGPGVRVDSGAYEGWPVPIEYDPLIAKLIVWDETRAGAIGRLRAALREYTVGGIHTTLGFFREVVEDEDFCAGRIDTGFIGRRQQRARPDRSREQRIAALAAGFHYVTSRRGEEPAPRREKSEWGVSGRDALLR